MNYFTHRILSLYSSHSFNRNITFFFTAFQQAFFVYVIFIISKKQTIFPEIKNRIYRTLLR